MPSLAPPTIASRSCARSESGEGTAVLACPFTSASQSTCESRKSKAAIARSSSKSVAELCICGSRWQMMSRWRSANDESSGDESSHTITQSTDWPLSAHRSSFVSKTSTASRSGSSSGGSRTVRRSEESTYRSISEPSVRSSPSHTAGSSAWTAVSSDDAMSRAWAVSRPETIGAGSARRPEAATGEGGCCDGDVSDDWRSPASSRSSPSRLLSGCACAETSSSARERRAV
mmetsp:Transcript_18872/g.55820  ORF Transcript_18872/g.55820 Transcript_18872/m.55820 type:complete len:231 (+) Transcript_18872:489-1181(+)